MVEINELLKKIEMISFYPIYYFQNNILFYPPANIRDNLPLASDPELAAFLLNSDQLVIDQTNPDIFYVVNHFKDASVCILGPFSHLDPRKMCSKITVSGIPSKINSLTP